MAKDTFEFDAAVGSNLDYGVQWVLEADEVIVTSTWTVLSGAVTVSAEQVDGSITAAFLAPTIIGQVVKVLNQITTNNEPPRIDSRTVVLSVKRR